MANPQANPQQQSVQNTIDAGPAILNVSFTDATGKVVANPLQIRVPRELSKKIAKLYLLEMLLKLLKAVVDKLLEGLGF